jgi:hypothetical protein
MAIQARIREALAASGPLVAVWAVPASPTAILTSGIASPR